MNRELTEVETAAKAFGISSRILRDNDVIMIVNREELRKFAIKVAAWSIAGSVIMLGYAYLWEKGEDERKENWRRKREEKKRKELRRVLGKDAKKAR